MTTKAGYYGSDAKTNRFIDPKTNEAYFVLVNKTTGEMELYNEEFLADKRVGTISTDGTIEYNKNWWGGANANDKAFAERAIKDGTIMHQASNIIKKEGGLSEHQASSLLKSNQGNPPEFVSTDIQLQNQSAAQQGVGKNAARTRTTFPGGAGSEPLVFPEAIRNTTQDIIKFNMMKYSPKQISQEGRFGTGERNRTNRDIIGAVVLPIPGGIQDSMSVQWGQKEMTAVQAELANVALEGIKDLNAGVDAAMSSAQKVQQFPKDVQSALAAYFAGEATGMGGDLLTRATGAILNPNMELLFQGPTLRPFTFSFQLAPRSKKEAQTIIKIIRFFKQGMAPIRTKSNLFLKSPHTFQLAYKYRGAGNQDQDHPFLNKFKECALQGFNVQYAPQGNYATFDDGVMLSYQISMTLQELEPIFNDDFPQDGDRSVGY